MLSVCFCVCTHYMYICVCPYLSHTSMRNCFTFDIHIHTRILMCSLCMYIPLISFHLFLYVCRGRRRRLVMSNGHTLHKHGNEYGDSMMATHLTKGIWCMVYGIWCRRYRVWVMGSFFLYSTH
ncbi:hypothetical protein EON63_13985 [archaeon]|nr:MAG: hypothetical protein EON63_13985 [archaeon]